MAKVSVELRVAADAEAIWELIGAFGRLADWAAGVRSSAVDGEDVGAVRIVETADGRRRRERLESYDEVGRSYSYTVLDEQTASREHLATLKVWANRDGSAEIVWSSEFEGGDTPDPEGCAAIEAFYRASLENVRARLG